jgi:hypothetical protein
MEYSIFDFIGNIGVALIIGAYLLIQIGQINSQSLGYSVANAVGAVLILVSLIANFNVSAFVIEFFWLLISVYGMYNWYKPKRNRGI